MPSRSRWWRGHVSASAMGGSSKKVTVGYWYLVGYHAGLGVGPIDAFLEFRAGNKTAWAGELTSSGTIHIEAENLWGGKKDQGGIVGDVDVMFGEADQQPNQYLIDTFGPQQPAWRGMATLVFKGGKYGAMNPYPQPASYKITKILKGWDTVCWYPDKAVIPGYSSQVTLYDDLAMAGDVLLGPQIGPDGYIEVGGFDPSDELVLRVVGDADSAWSRWPVNTENSGRAWTCGVTVTKDDGSMGFYLDDSSYSSAHYFPTAAEARAFAASQPDGVFTGSTYYRLHFNDWFVNLNRGVLHLKVSRRGSFMQTMNPAHILYYSRTQADMGRESQASINVASFTSAADWFYAQGFGLCTSYDSSAESVEEFEQRICRVAGCSLTRSLIDGRWHLDIANGEYVLSSLPTLTDDDILNFEEQPTLLDGAVNSVSIKYFDPARAEEITTSPAQAPAMISDFGTNHLTIDYLEIPSGELAARVAQRELLARITPLRGFSLTTTRRPHAWRPGTYVRLQAPKRGIADMVCILGEKSSGQLRSGAMTISLTQDVYGLPATSFVAVERGVDTLSPPPRAIVLQRAFEAPYTEIASSLSRADLAVLPPDVGYLMCVAVDPATSLDFTVMTDAGAGYVEAAIGDWCATAIVTEASSFVDTVFTLGDIVRAHEIEVGTPALWGSEIVRVDTFDPGTGAISVGRGCADTAPVKHAAGARIWFYASGAATDPTEYTDGETITVKLLTNTGTQQVSLVNAAAISATMDARAARPYLPGKLRINGDADPTALSGTIVVSGVHRDRLQQADQLIDHEMAGIGPEVGTTYTVRYFLNEVLVHTDSGLNTLSSSYAPSGGGLMRVEVESVRAGLNSYQMHVREFVIGLSLQAESGALITTEDNQPILMR